MGRRERDFVFYHVGKLPSKRKGKRGNTGGLALSVLNSQGVSPKSFGARGRSEAGCLEEALWSGAVPPLVAKKNLGRPLFFLLALCFFEGKIEKYP
ncbi:hypothetical protein NL676_010607 [Syzygium grande]|nr:hypothetical protein NL676_010607 [Syzygium grande]